MEWVWVGLIALGTGGFLWWCSYSNRKQAKRFGVTLEEEIRAEIIASRGASSHSQPAEPPAAASQTDKTDQR
jgi:hypothetical protein